MNEAAQLRVNIFGTSFFMRSDFFVFLLNPVYIIIHDL